MKYRTYIRPSLHFGLCLLIWSYAPIILSAQCGVYFSHCPENVIITDCDNDGTEVITWPMPVAATTGGCSAFGMLQTGGPVMGSVVTVPGTYVIKYTAGAIDMVTHKKPKATCTFSVQVQADMSPPVFTYCPPDITLYTGSNLGVAGIWTTPIAEDNCGEGVTMNSEIPCNTMLKPGVHVITYQAVDAAGNVSYCSFTVTVIYGFPRPAENRDGTEDQNAFNGTSPYPFEITLSPNPFGDVFSLNANQDPGMELTISVFDAQGQQAASYTWKAGTNSRELNAGKLPPGVYYIKIATQTGEFVSAIRAVKM